MALRSRPTFGAEGDHTMFFVTNIFHLPFLFLIWLIEAYFFTAVLRAVLTFVPNGPQSYMYRQVKLLTDIIPDFINRRLAKVSGKPVPSWAPWAITIFVLLVVRQALILIVINTGSKFYRGY